VTSPALRPGRADEAAEMVEVMAETLAAEAAGGAIAHAFPDPAREAAWLRYLLATGAGWVAEQDGHLAGFGITARRGPIDWLVSLFVRPQAQGNGLGRRLLDRLWPPAPQSERATLVDAASRPATSLYLHAGLTPRFPVLAFEGLFAPPDAGDPRARSDEAPSRPLVEVLDSDAFGSHRPGDHAYWTEAGCAFRRLCDEDQIGLGYGRWDPAGRLGPVVLKEGADWPGALRVLSQEAADAGIGRLRLLVPATNAGALQACRGMGLRYLGSEIAMATCPLEGWSRCLIHRAGLP
jgi:GNAT superfamily N-acetyltransferase